jgi:hypothetical protein
VAVVDVPVVPQPTAPLVVPGEAKEKRPLPATPSVPAIATSAKVEPIAEIKRDTKAVTKTEPPVTEIKQPETKVVADKSSVPSQTPSVTKPTEKTPSAPSKSPSQKQEEPTAMELDIEHADAAGHEKLVHVSSHPRFFVVVVVFFLFSHIFTLF